MVGSLRTWVCTPETYTAMVNLCKSVDVIRWIAAEAVNPVFDIIGHSGQILPIREKSCCEDATEF